MKLYLLENDGVNRSTDYGEDIDAVVCAKNEDAAKMMFPDGDEGYRHGDGWDPNNLIRDNLRITYLGEAAESIEEGVITSSNVGQ
jgi:hypothetical protein